MSNQYGGYEDQEYVAEYYDACYAHRNGKNAFFDKDVEFFVDCSKAVSGPTLELGCGTGRVLIPTAQAGCEITGLDLSTHMLAKCREKLGAQPPDVQKRVKLLHSNMTCFSTGEKYPLITIPARTFHHLISTEDQKACLGSIHQHLEAQGRVIIDVFSPAPVSTVPRQVTPEEKEFLPETAMPDGRKVCRTNRVAAYHKEQQYNELELIYYVTYPNGRKERLVQAFPFRYFFRYEMEHLLELCRFKIVDLYGDFDKSAFTADSPEMIFVAQKK